MTTRFLFAGLAVCWLAVAAASWRGRRRDVSRRGPIRWHRAVATLRDWSPEPDGPPAAATWCRPMTRPTMTGLPTVPLQRQSGSHSATTV